jgi:leucyl/phenylalanyl-tRNA--protein transferase
MPIPWLGRRDPFPPVEEALDEPNGLLAAGGDLSPERLLDAYKRGIFPWFNDEDPVLWWSPDPRMVLFVDEFHVRRSLARVVRAERFDVRVDSAFREVMVACASVPRPGQYGTWITPSVVDAYCALHARGLAHSVEA